MTAPYRHTQSGWIILWSVGAGGVLALAATLPLGIWWVSTLCVLVPALTIFLLGSLTVEVEPGTLRIRFGPGLIRKQFSLEGIASCERVSNPWYFGWGIRITPHGWLFNVSGLDAVELRWEGGKRVRIGTDEPDRLIAALRQWGIPRQPGRS